MLVLTSYLHLEKSKIEFSQDKTQNSDETIVFDRKSTSHGPKSLKIVVLLLLFSYVFNIQSSYPYYLYYQYLVIFPILFTLSILSTFSILFTLSILSNLSTLLKMVSIVSSIHIRIMVSINGYEYLIVWIVWILFRWYGQH